MVLQEDIVNPHFCLDIETLGIESTAVILSIGVVKFDPTKKPTIAELKNNSFYINIDPIAQRKEYGRTVDKSTMVWWNSQSDQAKQFALQPDESHLPVSALNQLNIWLKEMGYNKKSIVWTRGTLDSMAVDSLYRAVGMTSDIAYHRYRDIRTFICTVYGSHNGYCDLEDFTEQETYDKLLAHHPVDDCIRDVCMMLYGKMNG